MNESKTGKPAAEETEETLKEGVKNSKNPIGSENGAVKDKKEKEIRYQGNVYQDNLGQLSVPMKDDITVVWKEGM